MNLEDKLNLILDYKNDIKNSLIKKGSDIDNSTPLSGYAEKIDNLPTGSSDVELWKPDPLWWDIKSILLNDNNTGDYAYLNDYRKMIFLIDDSQDTLNIPLMVSTRSSYGRWHAVKTSDGQLYTTTSSTQDITHTWNKTMDKPSSDPLVKTRYIIYYLNPSKRASEFPQHVGVMGLYNQVISMVWAIDMSTNDTGHFGYQNCPKLQAFELLEGYDLLDRDLRVPFDPRTYYENDYTLKPFEKSIKFIKWGGRLDTVMNPKFSNGVIKLLNASQYVADGTYVLLGSHRYNDNKGKFVWSPILNYNEIMSTYFNEK